MGGKGLNRLPEKRDVFDLQVGGRTATSKTEVPDEGGERLFPKQARGSLQGKRENRVCANSWFCFSPASDMMGLYLSDIRHGWIPP